MTRTINEEASSEKAEARRTMSGLEYMRKMMAGELTSSGMEHLMDFRLVEVAEGRAVFSIKPDERHYNGLSIVHGGLAATLLDSAMGCAINTMMPAGKIFTTLEMKINYTRSMRRETGEVLCEASVIHVGGRTATPKAGSWIVRADCTPTAPPPACCFGRDRVSGCRTRSVWQRRFAAMPPDVRWRLPEVLPESFRGCAPELGRSPRIPSTLAGRAQPFRTSGGTAANRVST